MAAPTGLADRLPPQNLEAEQGTIGSMVLDPSVIDDIMLALDWQEFYRDAHQILCRTIYDLHSEGVPVDCITIEERLRREGNFDKAGGFETLADCVQRTPHAANGRYHAGIVKEKAIARSLVDAYNEGLRECYSNEHSAEALVEAAEVRVFAVGERGRAHHEAVAAHSEGASVLANIDRMRATGVVPGIRTGFRDFDALLGGLAGGQLVVAGARPSMGKSAWAIQLAMNASEIHGFSSLFVSLEMGREEITTRMLCVRSRMFASKLRNPASISEFDMRALGQAQADLAALPPFLIADTPSMTAQQIAASARRHRARDRVGLVVVDYLQLVDSPDGRDSRQEQIAKISRRLKTLARELDVPVLALSQLNRKAEDRDDRRPRMADLRESGAVEQDADIVILLHRPEYYDPNDSPGLAEVIVAKNRNGPTGTVKLAFDRRCTRFDDLAPDQPGDHEDAPF